jgi:hypothetical protein
MEIYRKRKNGVYMQIIFQPGCLYKLSASIVKHSTTNEAA